MGLLKIKLMLSVKPLLNRNKNVLHQSKPKQSKKQKLRLKRKLRLNAKQLLRLNKNVLPQSKQKQHKRQRLRQNKKQRLKLRRRLRLRPKQKLERKQKQNKLKSLNCLNRMLMNVIKLLPKVLLQQVKKIYFHSQLTHHYKLIHLQRLPSPLTSIITSQ